MYCTYGQSKRQKCIATSGLFIFFVSCWPRLAMSNRSSTALNLDTYPTPAALLLPVTLTLYAVACLLCVRALPPTLACHAGQLSLLTAPSRRCPASVDCRHASRGSSCLQREKTYFHTASPGLGWLLAQKIHRGVARALFCIRTE